MEIVIKIPDSLYANIIDTWEKIHPQMWDAIKNSTPLPRKHGDLIDKGKFKRWIETQDGDKLMTEYYLDALDMQETVVGGSYDEDID